MLPIHCSACHATEIISKATAHTSAVCKGLYLPYCWLEVSIHPVGSYETFILTQVLLIIISLQGYSETVPH
jgi:hypothetical protein